MTEPQQTERHDTEQATIRRAPRLGRFIGLGALLGLIVTIVVTMQYPADPNVGMGATIAYFSLYGVSAGVVLGAVVGLAIDRASRRRSKPITVEHAVVEESPEAATADTAAERTAAEVSDGAASQPAQQDGEQLS